MSDIKMIAPEIAYCAIQILGLFLFVLVRMKEAKLRLFQKQGTKDAEWMQSLRYDFALL